MGWLKAAFKDSRLYHPNPKQPAVIIAYSAGTGPVGGRRGPRHRAETLRSPCRDRANVRTDFFSTAPGARY
jgi:hypothetical protein